jgi:hypothetical protein
MLIFKARPRKTPNLSETITPSQRRIMNLMGSAMDEVRAQVVRDEKKITDALLHDPVEKVVNMVSTDPWLNVQERLETELRGEVLDAGRRVKLPSITKATLTYSFDADRPEAGAWAAKQSGNLIREVVDEQRAMVREYVERSTAGEFTVTQVSRGLRDVVGLTSQQSGWVENFRNREILEQMNRGNSFDEAYNLSEKKTAAYQKRIHKYRTETIARTETIRASSEGRQQAWSQGLEQGFISQFAKKKWLAESDACDICTPLGSMDPIPIKSSFPAGEPPAHPNCRCDVLLVDDPDEYEAMTDEDLDAIVDEALEGFPNYRGVDLMTPVNPQGDVARYGNEAVRAAKGYRDRMALAEPQISRKIIDLADEHGARPEGLAFRLKSEESLSRKIAEKVQEEKISGVVTTADEAAASMSDVIRYTYVVDDDVYSVATQRILADLEASGYTLRVKNYWQPQNTYKGINVAMKDPDGIPVELQFHTAESLKVKEGALHQIYERQRVLTDPDAIEVLNKEMRDVAATIPTPRGDLSFGEKIKKSTLKMISRWSGAKLGVSQKTGRRGL